MAIGRAHAVRAGITAADDHDVTPAGKDLVRQLFARANAVLCRKELQREMHAVEFASGDRQVARLLGTTGQHHGVEIVGQLLRRDLLLARAQHGTQRKRPGAGHQHTGAEFHAFDAHLCDAPLDEVLFQLEVGNAVAQQPARAVVLLVYRHRVPGPRQLLGARQPRRTATYDGHLTARRAFRKTGHDPPFRPGPIHDGMLERLDPDGAVVDIERASGLAGGGADAAGKFREVVRRMQNLTRLVPLLAVDEVVEVGNDVVDRAAVAAKRYAAVHAARALDLRLLGRQVGDELAPVLRAPAGRLRHLLLARKFQKTRDLSHD